MSEGCCKFAKFVDSWDIWGVQIEMVPLTSCGRIPKDGQDWFSCDAQLSVMALPPFLSHTPLFTELMEYH